jgi:hypothetical protein
VPYFNLPPYADCEVPAGWGEGDGRDLFAEGEVVEDDASRDIGEDGAAVFVDGEEEVAARVQCEARDVLSVGERERI